MPKYQREIPISGKSAQELYDRVSSEIDRLMHKLPIQKYDLNRDPVGKTVSFKSSYASATLICGDGKLTLDGNLSFMALPFKSKIDGFIDRWITQAFS